MAPNKAHSHHYNNTVVIASLKPSPSSIFPNKKTHNKFRCITGRAEGMLISFEAHLLGDKIEFDEAGGTLMLRNLPTQLTDQLKRASA